MIAESPSFSYGECVKDVTITGWNPLACGEDDTYATGFIAIDPQGKVVEGTVCSGVFKGATIRF